jgi:hypothetical protein
MPRSILLAALLFGSITTNLAGQQLHLTPTKCPSGITGIAGCPVDGCGGVSDALLNDAKNRTDSPTSEPSNLKVPDMVAIEEPEDWLTGQDRGDLSANEGRPVQLMGYLSIVKTETSGETCNCELHKQVDTDLHLAIVEHKNDAEEDSVTAEITPRIRLASHPSWANANVVKLKGKFVRVTGWLMLDTAHLPHTKKVNADDHAGSPVTRATNWEVHPVTKLEVCTSTAKSCMKGTGWRVVN